MKQQVHGDIFFDIIHLRRGGKKLKICRFSINTAFLNAIEEPEEKELFISDPSI